MATATSKLAEAGARIRRWRENPVAFAFEELHFDPEPWQRDVLDVFPSQDADKMRIAMLACTGPGKTAILAVCALNFISCYGEKGLHPKGACVSITEDNLRANLWAELSVWQQRSEYLKHAFTWTKSRFFANDHPETWWIEARTWSKLADKESQGRTLSGLHAPFVAVFLDEAGDMPIPILRSAEQIFSAEFKWAKIVVAGNPTSLEGILYHAANMARKLWVIVRITADPDDPNRSRRTNIDNARTQIEQYGRDNPWVMATILGQFPPASINALLGIEEVQAAMGRHLRIDQFEWAQKRLGIDAAWRGDDKWVIFPRQGLASFMPVAMRNPKTQEIGSRIIQAKTTFGSEREYFDDTGGFAAGASDFFEAAGYTPVKIDFSGKPMDPRFYNKRAELWWDMAQWVKNGGALPNVPELVGELTVPTYTYQNGKFLIEPKDQIKARLGRSPDYGDSLCFVQNTMIATPSGLKPIQDLAVGDMVTTPFGPSPVAVTWESTAKAITTAKFSNGSELSGRPEHEVFVWNDGFRRMDELESSDTVEPYSKWRLALWRLVSLSFILGGNTGFKTLVDILTRAGTMTPSAFCIAGFGSTITALYRMAWRFTTKTVTGVITTFPISSYSRAGNISAAIWPNSLRARSTSNGIRPTWKMCEKRRLSGTDHQRAALGTEPTENRHGKAASQSAPYAESAEPTSKHSFLLAPAIAPSPALWRSRSGGISQVLESVNSAVNRLWRIVTGRRPVVPISVETESVPPTPVYNLTLREHNAYYANGILVFNCLTFAEPDMPAGLMSQLRNSGRAQTDFDPFRSEESIAKHDFDPYRDTI